jgi:ATP diphosphatase
MGEGAKGAVREAVAPEVVAALAEAVAIMARLRGPEGCPWDREQTFDTIKRHTLEETYEVFDAIERRAWPELKDELGDLLLQVLFYAQMAADAGYFDIGDVAAGLNAKLVRRHPHVFGEVDAADAEAVLRNWEEIKRAEKARRRVWPRDRVRFRGWMRFRGVCRR